MCVHFWAQTRKCAYLYIQTCCIRHQKTIIKTWKLFNKEDFKILQKIGGSPLQKACFWYILELALTIFTSGSKSCYGIIFINDSWYTRWYLLVFYTSRSNLATNDKIRSYFIHWNLNVEHGKKCNALRSYSWCLCLASTHQICFGQVQSLML